MWIRQSNRSVNKFSLDNLREERPLELFRGDLLRHGFAANVQAEKATREA